MEPVVEHTRRTRLDTEFGEDPAALSLSIVVADVDALVTDALAHLLERRGHRVLISVPAHSAVYAAVRAFHADACVIDLALRDGQDPADIERLVNGYPDLKVVVRTAEASPVTMQAVLSAGAVGYLHKSRGPLLLLDLLARVVDGEVVVEGSFARAAPALEEAAADFRRLVGFLTPRERECLDLTAEGLGTTAIAARLGVSAATVRSHVQSVLNKLGVHSRLEAASLASRFQPRPITPTDSPAHRTG